MSLKEGIKMKRKFKIITLIVSLATAMTGCMNKKVNELSVIDGEGIPKDTKTTLKYVSWDQLQKGQINATIQGFNEIYPDIKVEVQYIGWNDYWTKMEAAATAGNMPDVITMHTNQIAKYVNYNKVLPLEEAEMKRYDPDFSYDNYLPGVTRLYTFYDKHFGVPKDFDCIVLVYNKKIFDDAGLPYPNDSWTWNDLEETAAKLTDIENNMYGFGAFNALQDGFGNFIYQNKGYIVDEKTNKSGFDDPKSIEAMNFFYKLYQNYSPSAAAFAETDSKVLFSAGNIAMMFFGNWNLNQLYDNQDYMEKYGFGIAALPSSNDGNKATIMNGLAWSLPTSCKNPDAAKQLIAYLGSEKGQRDAAMGPSIPVFNGVVNDWAELNKHLFDPNAVIDQIPYGVQFAATESKTQWETVQNKYTEQIFANKISVEAAFNQIAKEMNEILAKEQAKLNKQETEN